MPTQDQQERITEIVRQLAQRLVDEKGISIADTLWQIAGCAAFANNAIHGVSISVLIEGMTRSGKDFTEFYGPLYEEVEKILYPCFEVEVNESIRRAAASLTSVAAAI